jgi:flagella basal body P-ring formation protein FlgA
MGLIVSILLLFNSSITITKIDIERFVSDYVAERLSAEQEPYEIEFRTVPESFELNASEYTLHINPDRGVSFRGNISLPVDVVADGRTNRRLIVSLRVRRYGEVFIASGSIPRHADIDPDQLVRLTVETTMLPDDLVTKREQIAGKRSNRNINEGVILRESMLETAPMIHSGDPVTLEVRRGSVTVTTAAVARGDGAAGDIIQVQRAGTHERLRARVINNRKVVLVNENEAR